MITSVGGHADIVWLLFEAGAEVNYKTKSGTTALMYASREGKIDIVKLLRKAGAK